MIRSRWYLVRHAQTSWNGERRIQGSADPPLSARGRQQARCLARYFSGRPIRAIVSSGMQRTQETALAIASTNGHRLQPVIEPDLREIHLGAWEGLTPEEIDARYPGAYDRWRLIPSSTLIPNAERLEIFLQRVRGARERLLATLQAEEAVIVAHGGVIAALLADALCTTYDHCLQHVALDNAGISAVAFEAGRPPSVLWVNATAHLETPVG